MTIEFSRFQKGLEFVGGGHQRQIEIAQDAVEHVVEVVGDAGGQLADGLHFLGLAQLGFQSGLLFFDPVLVDGDFDSRMQFSFGEGLEQIAERLGYLGALQGIFIGKGREIDHRNVEALPYVFCRLHPVHFPVQLDIHQHQIRSHLSGLLDGQFAGRGHLGNFVAQALEFALDVQSDDAFVFDDHDSRQCHSFSVSPVNPLGFYPGSVGYRTPVFKILFLGTPIKLSSHLDASPVSLWRRIQS